MPYALRIDPSDEGRRLDKVIRSIWPGLPLSVLMKGIRTGAVRLDGKKADFAGRVEAGQELYVPWEAPKERREESPFRRTMPVLYSDSRLWVVDKPANLLVQPDTKGQDNVIDRVRYMLRLQGDAERAYAVHRLDRNTTGALLVALSGGPLRALQDAFRERRIGKTYLAVVVGRPPRQGTIDRPLLKDPGSNTVTVSPKGKEALTRYRLLAAGREVALVAIDLVTGRSHQARVHMASAGFPVLGDLRYGDDDANRRWRKRGVQRPLLHSHRLQFDAFSGELEDLSGLLVTAPLPGDMEALTRSEGWPVPEILEEGGGKAERGS